MTNPFADVNEFHRKFELDRAPSPAFLQRDLHNFRRRFITEELTELDEAVLEGDLVKTADAIIDTIYVLIGMGNLMGLPLEQLWDAVHNANMRKVRATPAPDADPKKRGGKWDVVKPPGWTPAPIEAILNVHQRLADGRR